MSRRFFGSVVCLVVVVSLVGSGVLSGVVAQDAKKTEETGAKKRSGDRLPANYAKIGLSEDQKKKIYDLQSKYEGQIDVLEKQIVDLKAKQASEVEAVLTDVQKKSLQDANEESKRKSAEKKKAAAKQDKPKEKGDK